MRGTRVMQGGSDRNRSKAKTKGTQVTSDLYG